MSAISDLRACPSGLLPVVYDGQRSAHFILHWPRTTPHRDGTENFLHHLHNNSFPSRTKAEAAPRILQAVHYAFSTYVNYWQHHGPPYSTSHLQYELSTYTKDLWTRYVEPASQLTELQFYSELSVFHRGWPRWEIPNVMITGNGNLLPCRFDHQLQARRLIWSANYSALTNAIAGGGNNAQLNNPPPQPPPIRVLAMTDSVQFFRGTGRNLAALVGHGQSSTYNTKLEVELNRNLSTGVLGDATTLHSLKSLTNASVYLALGVRLSTSTTSGQK